MNTLRTSREDVLRRLPELLTPEDAVLLAAHPPLLHPQLPAIILPGTGPHAVNYSAAEGRELVLGRKAGEAVMRGAHIYLPGILACTPGLARGDLVIVSGVLPPVWRAVGERCWRVCAKRTTSPTRLPAVSLPPPPQPLLQWGWSSPAPSGTR